MWAWITFWNNTPRLGWKPLPTPRRIIYIDTKATERNQEIADLFLRGRESPSITDVIDQVLSLESSFWDVPEKIRLWNDRVKTAKCYRIHRCICWIAGGWAQRESAQSGVYVFGLEAPWLWLGIVTQHAVGHELVHAAQDVRSGIFQAEWSGMSLMQALFVEGEALVAFCLVPLTYAAIVGGSAFIWAALFWP